MQNEMRDRLINLIDEAINDEETSYSNIADYLIENGVIVPPCKAGDVVYVTVYNIKTSTFNIHRGYISNISFAETGNRVTISHEGYDDEPLFNKFYGRFEDFGKVIFFTREEAEAKLRERN